MMSDIKQQLEQKSSLQDVNVDEIASGVDIESYSKPKPAEEDKTQEQAAIAVSSD